MTRRAPSTFRRSLVTLTCASAAALTAWGQSRAPVGSPAWLPRLAGDEQSLWVARVDEERSLVRRRGVAGPFESLDTLRGEIAHMTGAEGVLYVMVRDGTLYSASEGRWSRRLDPPRRSAPLDWVADECGVVALIPSPARDEMSRLVGGVRPPTSQPFDPGPAALSVVRLDSQGWIALAACPKQVTADSPYEPRLGFIQDELCLAVATADGRQVEVLALEPQTGRWQPRGATPPVPGLNRFWLTTVSRLPTLVVTSRTPAGREEVAAFRRLGGAGERDAPWRAAALRLSELPAGSAPQRYDTALGFNQHIVFLVNAAPEGVFLQFGRLDGAPAEKTVRVADVFADGQLPGAGLRWVQASTLLVLFAVLVSLFVFRRRAMVTPATLPADAVLALAIQRLLGWAVDLAPFALAFAPLFGIDAQRAGQELFNWAAGGDAATGRFPSPPTLRWWSASCAAYTAYALLLELLTRRTVGKLLTGTRVLTESGARPTVAAVITRNLFRFIEMMPPLWVLGFLVVLSRNRQRLGDIFARTVVVRPARPPKPADRQE